MKFGYLIFIFGLLSLSTLSFAEDDDESPILLTLTEPNEDKTEISILDKSIDEEEVPVKVETVSFFQPSTTSSTTPSNLAAFQFSSTERPRPILNAIKNFDVSSRINRITARIGKIRERIGRFRIPTYTPNEESRAFRTGRRVGQFIQNTNNRIRSFADGLRARAATRTPTAP